MRADVAFLFASVALFIQTEFFKSSDELACHNTAVCRFGADSCRNDDEKSRFELSLSSRFVESCADYSFRSVALNCASELF